VHNKPLAAIDIGTNTFRLLIAEVRNGPDKHNYSFKEICSERIITRLGEGIHDSGHLNAEAIERGVNALKDFSRIIAANNVHKTSAIATSALRDADNSTEFIKQVKDKTGIEIEIISGEEEAGLTAAGIQIDMDIPESSLILDIGGGSTELILFKNPPAPTLLKGKNATTLLVRSFNLGVVYLADRYMENDPPSDNDLNKIKNDVSQKINKVAGPFKKLISDKTVLTGTAGTVTALAAMAQGLDRYEHSKIHNFKLTREKVKEIFSGIATVTSQERAKYIPFEPARLDIIVPGALILLRLMEIFGFTELTVSNYGLREGILIDLYNRTVRSQ
jgi:exopolyphosphatase/guanosine-5'-triphosphate,3'-diphosphate pyrophosphatase